MSNSKEESARFLMQATLGVDYATMTQVSTQGIENWLDEQLNNSWRTEDSFYRKVRDLWRGRSGNSGFRKLFKDRYTESRINGDGNNPALPYNYYFRMAWWHRTLAKGVGRRDSNVDPVTETAKITAEESDSNDLLRHRIAQALSEILVISENSILELDAEGMATFYDLLYKHAFGNYKDLLTEVSLHPCMGVYLTHINNRKGDSSQKIHPDENYAREVMQLFTIGLFELNADGTRKKNAQGKDIPTYDNDDIKELARVFTGVKADKYQYEWPSAEVGEEGDRITFGSIEGDEILLDDNVSKTFKMVPYVDMITSMRLDDSFHDLNAKSLLNGWIQLPQRTAQGDGSSTRLDIEQAIARLVSHANTAPFIAMKLIQQLVTSNPLPDYVRSVASKFGAEGNLKAVIREILVYPLSNPVTRQAQSNGNGNIEKLKSPLLRVTQLLRAFQVRNDSNRMWLVGEDIKAAVNQHPLCSPTVFNFYKSDFTPHGPIEEAEKQAPEFELHNAYTSISYVNMLYDWLFGEALPVVSTEIQTSGGPIIVPELDGDRLLSRSENKLRFDFTEELELAKNYNTHDQLIERISLLLTGKEQSSIKPQIKNAFANYDPAKPNERLWIVQTVVFMVALSPDFTVLER